MKLENHERKGFRFAILHTATANFESWIHTPRTIVLLMFSLALCFLETRGTVEQLRSINAQVFWNEIVFNQLSYGSNILISTALFLSMMSEIPRRMRFQNYMLIRNTKRVWLCGQIVYIILLVLIFLGCMICGSIIFSADALIPGTGWSDPSRIASGIIAEFDAFIPVLVRQEFSPLVSILMASMPLFVFWFAILMTIFAFSLCDQPNLGVVFCAMNIYSVLLFGIANVDEKWFLINYTTLAHIFSDSLDLAKLWHVMLGFAAYIVLLICYAALHLKTKDILINAND